MKKLEKLGMYLAGISAVISIFAAITTYINLNVGESLGWFTAAAWASTSLILELNLYKKDGNSDT